MRLEQVGLCNLFVTMSWKKRSLWCPLNITWSTSTVSNLSHGVNTRTMIEQNVFQALLTIIHPTHCVINVTFFIPFWSPETTILLGCTEKSRLLTPLATPIFEQEQSACSAIFSPSELSDCMISLFHGPLVWAEYTNTNQKVILVLTIIKTVSCYLWHFKFILCWKTKIFSKGWGNLIQIALSVPLLYPQHSKANPL